MLTKRGECLMTGSVEESDEAVVVLNLVGADVLGYTTGLGGGGFIAEEGVEEGSFAVVDVAHDGDDRGTRNGAIGEFALFRRVIFCCGLLLDFNVREAELLDDDCGCFVVDALVDGRDDAVFKQLSDKCRDW